MVNRAACTRLTSVNNIIIDNACAAQQLDRMNCVILGFGLPANFELLNVNVPLRRELPIFDRKSDGIDYRLGTTIQIMKANHYYYSFRNE